MPYLRSLTGPKPVLGCINSPTSVTLCGCEESISSIEAALRGRAPCKRLFVKTAYHSPEIQELVWPYWEALADIKARATGPKSTIHMFSSLTGRLVDDASLATPQYWVDNLVFPVDFQDAMTTALNFSSAPQAAPIVLEIGPHGALQSPIKQIATAREAGPRAIPCTSLLTRRRDAVGTILEAAEFLIQHGYPVLSRSVGSTTIIAPSARPEALSC